MSPSRIFFEPWGFGDAVLAAAVARETPGSVVACQAAWQPLLGLSQCLSVQLPYATGQRQSRWDMQGLAPLTHEPAQVLNIRGDVRDWWAAKHLFPQGRRRFNGWLQFAPHYCGWLDWKWRPVRNRYRAWADLAGVAWSQLETTYRQRQADRPRNGRVLIHAGARRRCRQYPHVAGLVGLLRQQGWQTELVVGPGDAAAEGTRTLAGAELTEALLGAEWVIANDSGPMHLAAYLGCRTVAIARVTNIQEWLPPATRFVASPLMPRGYRYDPRYRTDELLEGWPAPAEVAAALGSAT